MKKEMAPKGFKYVGILSFPTKNPAKSIIGTTRTGVKATANCLSATVQPTMRDNAADALYTRILRPAKEKLKFEVSGL